MDFEWDQSEKKERSPRAIQARLRGVEVSVVLSVCVGSVVWCCVDVVVREYGVGNPRCVSDVML